MRNVSIKRPKNGVLGPFLGVLAGFWGLADSGWGGSRGSGGFVHGLRAGLGQGSNSALALFWI